MSKVSFSIGRRLQNNMNKVGSLFEFTNHPLLRELGE